MQQADESRAESVREICFQTKGPGHSSPARLLTCGRLRRIDEIGGGPTIDCAFLNASNGDYLLRPHHSIVGRFSAKIPVAKTLFHDCT